MYQLLEETKESIIERSRLYGYLRDFFAVRSVVEVHTSILSSYAATSPYVKPISLKNWGSVKYLHTSPEFAMKKILSLGMENIYQICSVFRDGEIGSLHRSEFTMLEWYRKNFSYIDLMEETIELISGYLNIFTVEKLQYSDAFKKYIGIDPFNISLSDLKILVDEDLVDGKDVTFDDYLGLCFNKYIEPNLKGNKIWIIYDYPETQAEYANVKKSSLGHNVAMRFEVYVDGVELANGYDELLCPNEQKKRMLDELGKSGSQIPIDEELLNALQKGIPKCSGIAMGIDRLLMLKAACQ